MAGLNLINTKQEWLEYTQRFSQENSLALSQVQWGHGPEQYPCLVASVPQGVGKIVSCYIYPEQAEVLLTAARKLEGIKEGPKVEEAECMSRASLAKMVRQMVLGEVGKSMREVTANLRAIVEELVAVKITTPERYEKLLVKHLADVDQYMAECKAGKAGKGTTASDTLLRRLMDDDCSGN